MLSLRKLLLFICVSMFQVFGSSRIMLWCNWLQVFHQTSV